MAEPTHTTEKKGFDFEGFFKTKQGFLIIGLLLFLINEKYQVINTNDDVADQRIDQVETNVISLKSVVDNNRLHVENEITRLEDKVDFNTNSVGKITELVAKNFEEDQKFKQEITKDLNDYKIEREKSIKEFYQRTLPEIFEQYGLEKKR